MRPTDGIWRMIFAKKGGYEGKIIEYFRRNVGKIVTGEEIAYLANGNSEWARRCRELRTEDGWPIVTKSSGRPDLPVGAYVLEEDKQAEPHDRKIPDKVRIEVRIEMDIPAKFVNGIIKMCGHMIADIYSSYIILSTMPKVAKILQKISSRFAMFAMMTYIKEIQQLKNY